MDHYADDLADLPGPEALPEPVSEVREARPRR